MSIGIWHDTGTWDTIGAWHDEAVAQATPLLHGHGRDDSTGFGNGQHPRSLTMRRHAA